jgi:hypothetical protein
MISGEMMSYIQDSSVDLYASSGFRGYVLNTQYFCQCKGIKGTEYNLWIFQTPTVHEILNG